MKNAILSTFLNVNLEHTFLNGLLNFLFIVTSSVFFISFVFFRIVEVISAFEFLLF